MGVYKRGNVWWIDYYLSGIRRREPVGKDGIITKGMAQGALRARLGEIAQGRYSLDKAKKPISFEKLVERFLEYSEANKRSWKRDICATDVFLKYLSGKKLSDITPFLVEKYKSDRRKQVKASTVNRELDVLRRMFSLAVAWGLITSNPVSQVKRFKVSNSNLRILSEEEFTRLYNSASSHLKPILLTAVHTGMRKGEILNLKWEDINLERGYILVRDSKNYESRAIPISQILKDELLKLKKQSTGEFVFTYKGKPIGAIKRAFSAALRRSGIRHCRFHDLRHTFATCLVMEGTDIASVQELMGHKDIRMTKRYSHPTPEHKRNAVEKVKFSPTSHNLVTIEDKKLSFSRDFKGLEG